MLLLHNAGQFLGMSPPPPAGRRCGQTSPATAGTGNRFPSGQSRPVSLTVSVQPAGTTTSPGETATRSSSSGPNTSLSSRTADTGGWSRLQTPPTPTVIFPAMKTVWRRESSPRPVPVRTWPQVSWHLIITDSNNTACFPRKQEVSRWKQGLQVVEWKEPN